MGSIGDPRRQLPSVDRLLAHELVSRAVAEYGRTIVVEAARETLEESRGSASLGSSSVTIDDLARDVTLRLIDWTRGTLFPVINATGVIIHTNLGRAPLSRSALSAIQTVAGGYSNLEYDLSSGVRGSRYVHVEETLCRLTGAEAALVVNNNAGAVLLALAALARDREVVISRGQLVEIGGGFRVPDVLLQSGARLVEVGTTNRTHPSDYRNAIKPDTALLLKVHTSNFKQIGFTAIVELAELVDIGRQFGLLVMDDLGSGTLLDTSRYGLSPEPTVQDSVAAGADVITFSGDKLLGGPQAGLIIGREAVISQLRLHPLTRALRVGKTTLAALQATLLHYVRGDADQEIPVWRMIAATGAVLEQRARSWSAALSEAGIPSDVVAADSTIGGGSLPGEVLPTWTLAVRSTAPADLASRLRRGRHPVIVRILNDQVLFDARTVMPEEDATMLDALKAAWSAAS